MSGPHNKSTKGAGTSQVPQKVAQRSSCSLSCTAKTSSELLGAYQSSHCQPSATLGCAHTSIRAQCTSWRNYAARKCNFSSQVFLNLNHSAAEQQTTCDLTVDKFPWCLCKSDDLGKGIHWHITKGKRSWETGSGRGVSLDGSGVHCVLDSV